MQLMSMIASRVLITFPLCHMGSQIVTQNRINLQGHELVYVRVRN
jgi:hypothetical protein